jgi:hypothetical protein
MSFKRTGISVAVGLIVLAVGLILFKGDPNKGDFESDVAGLVSDNTGVSEDKITVDCPDDGFSTDDGSEFTCNSIIADKPTKLDVKFTDGDGNYVVTPETDPSADSSKTAVENKKPLSKAKGSKLEPKASQPKK